MIDIVYIGSNRSQLTRYFPPDVINRSTGAGNKGDLYIRSWVKNGFSVLFRGIGPDITVDAIIAAFKELRTYPGYENIGCVALDIPSHVRVQLINGLRALAEVPIPRIVISSSLGRGYLPLYSYVRKQLMRDDGGGWASSRADNIWSWDKAGNCMPFGDEQ